MRSGRGRLAAIVAGVAMVAGFALAAPVQAGVTAEGFTLGANSAYCEPGYLGPFEGCTPWEGVEVTFESSDGGFTGSCVTAGDDRAAGCTVVVPFGSTITASIDPAVIPDGYVLEGESSQVIEIPDGPPEGEFGGAAFVLLPEEDDEGDGDVSELPDTGDGVVIDRASPMTSIAGVLAVVSAALAMGGVELRRRNR